MRNPFRKKQSDEMSSARWQGVLKGRREKEHHVPRKLWHWGLAALLLVLLGGGAYVTWLYYNTQNRIRVPIPVTTESEGEPFNLLLVGSDSRRGLTEEEQEKLRADAIEGQRADTLILAHIDPATDHITMVQFPRDLWVPIDGGEPNKINSALETGRKTLVRTVEDLADLKINRYAEVNIAGFRDLVDAIGGVDVCITDPIAFDVQTGIEIKPDELGMQHFDGERALAFVRTRNFSTGDFQRIQNQQKFLAAAIDKVLSAGTIFNPTRVSRLADVAGDNVRIDRQTTILGLVDLGRKFQSFNPEDYEAYTVPNRGIGEVDGISMVPPDWPAIRALFGAIGRNQSPVEAPGVTTIDPTTVRVGVYNGTNASGKARRAARDIRRATTGPSGSVRIVEVDDARPKPFAETIIRYEASSRSLAEMVARAIPGATLEEHPTRAGVDVAVIVGSEPFETRKLVQVLQIPIPRPSALPKECRA